MKSEPSIQGEIPQFLIAMLQQQYGNTITETIRQGYQKKRPVTLRINTLKTNQESIQKQLQEVGINYQTVTWNPDALIINNVRENEIQNLLMYQKGEIYLQNLSSMLPPIILNPKKHFDILDMAAAPGGKTSQMAALCKNEANITACEMNVIRAQRLQYNLEKQGASSVYVMVKDARHIDDFFAFDQILLDAPCSGSGTLQKDSLGISNFTEKLIQKSVHSQDALLKKAITILKPGCEMVYSTCSILKQENEDRIEKLLKEGKIEIVPISLEQLKGLPRLPVTIEGTLCVCPNELYEGFFIAKMRKKK